MVVGGGGGGGASGERGGGRLLCHLEFREGVRTPCTGGLDPT